VADRHLGRNNGLLRLSAAPQTRKVVAGSRLFVEQAALWGPEDSDRLVPNGFEDSPGASKLSSNGIDALVCDCPGYVVIELKRVFDCKEVAMPHVSLRLLVGILIAQIYLGVERENDIPYQAA
jgi:hypothetical protein